MRSLALGLLLVLAAAGCSAGARRKTPTAAVPPSPAAEPAPVPGAAPGSISAPWDTAGTAAARAARRSHVYPKGPNALGQKLVDSLPDPAALAPGARSSEPAKAAAPVPPPPSTPSSTATPKAQPAPSAPPTEDHTCWEVQVLVTSDRGRAEAARARVERDLDLAAWVREVGGVYRVRVGGCLTADGASGLAQRMKQEGYPEAFRAMRDP